jgi:hypothetical protein
MNGKAITSTYRRYERLVLGSQTADYYTLSIAFQISRFYVFVDVINVFLKTEDGRK